MFHWKTYVVLESICCHVFVIGCTFSPLNNIFWHFDIIFKFIIIYHNILNIFLAFNIYWIAKGFKSSWVI